MEEGKFPKDYATFVRYHEGMKKLKPRYPAPAPLSLEELDAFLEEVGDLYPVRWR